MDLLEGDVELTEFVEIDVQSIKGVRHGANGFPPLLMKGLAVAKGQRDCPKCDKSYDADHQGDKCENCGSDLPDVPASKAAADGKVNCPTCDGDGKIMAGKRDCPDCDASGKVTPAKAASLTAKSAGPPPWRDTAAKAVNVIRMGQFPPASAWTMIKAIDADGNVDEQPDLDGGQQAIALIAKLIQYEADELAAGNAGEAADIEMLCCAVNLLRSWMQGEASVQQGNVQPADMLMQSAAKADADDAAKSAIAEGGANVDTGDQGTGSEAMAKAVEDAIAKATAPIQELRKELEATLAKVKATPVPGGPSLSHNVQVKTPGGVQDAGMAAKAALMRAKAETATSPGDREGYLAYARELDAEARKAEPSA